MHSLLLSSSRSHQGLQPHPLGLSVIFRPVICALIVAFAAGGCRSDPLPSDSAPVTDTVVVTDALGRRVGFASSPDRLVTLAPNLTEMVYAAGAGSLLVGGTTADDYPPAVDTLTRFSAYPQIDFERLATLRPDLVLATDQVNAPRDAPTLAAVGAPVYFFSFSSLGDVFDGLRQMGKLLDTPTSAQATVDSLRAAVDVLRTRTADVNDPPLVLLLIGDETLYTFAQGSYAHDLVRLAGGRSATADLATETPLSEEFVLETRPDVIVGAFGDDYDPRRLLDLHPSWNIVPAVRNGRVYSIRSELLLRPGPRLVKGAQRLARLLHPDLFAQRPETIGSSGPK